MLMHFLGLYIRLVQIIPRTFAHHRFVRLRIPVRFMLFCHRYLHIDVCSRNEREKFRRDSDFVERKLKSMTNERLHIMMLNT